MMTVEEKPDVTYSDVGGSKEQIDKLREVVELPLLHVSPFYFYKAKKRGGGCIEGLGSAASDHNFFFSISICL